MFAGSCSRGSQPPVALTRWAGLPVPEPPGSPLAALPICSWCPDLLTKVMGLCGNFVGINICLSAMLGQSMISHVPFGNDISKQN